MDLKGIKLFNVNSAKLNRYSAKYNNLAPLPCDTVSFGAMKKSEFEIQMLEPELMVSLNDWFMIDFNIDAWWWFFNANAILT